MTSNDFDELTKKLAKPTSRRGILKMLGVGAAGGALAALGMRGSTATSAAPSTGPAQLGEQCKPAGTGKFACDASKHLTCTQITGAYRCECELGTIDCGDGTCRADCSAPQSCPDRTCDNGTCISCPSGFDFNSGTCTCTCPAATPEICNGTCVAACPSGQVRQSDCSCGCSAGTVLCNGTCVAACTAPLTLNTTTCTCTCPTGQVFCNGQCFNPSTACGTCSNKVFNAQCCSCENPGQPSGTCKGEICTADGCTCRNGTHRSF